MKRNKDDKGKEAVIRSSAAEYLTFVASTGENDASYEMRYEDENIWLTQKMMAALYAVSKQTISQHIKRIYADGELTPEMDPVHIFPINRDKENAVISRLFSMFSINLVQAKSSKNKGF